MSDQNRTRTPADSPAWLLGTTAGTLALTIISMHLPYLLGWLVNTVVILGVAGGVCAYKRSRASWACFWVLAAVCAAVPFLALVAGLMNGYWTATDWIVAVIEVTAWYWLFRFSHRRPAPAPAPQVVVHHHVVHGATAAGIPAEALSAVPGDVLATAAVPAAKPRKTVAGRIIRPAITAGSRKASSDGLRAAEAVLQRFRGR